MDASELDRIENSLGITLPEAYRNVMTDFPSPDDPFGYTCLLSTEADELISENSRLREKGFFRYRCWPDNFYALGWDGCGNYYFIRLDKQDETVYLADHEAPFDPESVHLLREQYEGLAAYLEYVREVEEECRLDEEQWQDRNRQPVRQTRPWWKRFLGIR